jgi:hypothetical protein
MFLVTFRQGNENKMVELTSEQLDLLEWLIDNDCIDVDGLKVEVKDSKNE